MGFDAAIVVAPSGALLISNRPHFQSFTAVTMYSSPTFLSLAFLLIAVSAGCQQHSQRHDGPADLPEWELRFTYEGKTIHPALIYKFLPWLSDTAPNVVAVDIAASLESNEFSSPIHAVEDRLTSELKNSEHQETFSYRRLGRLDDGTHVVRTYHTTGGTGVFESLLLFRLSCDNGNWAQSSAAVNERVILNLVGWFELGDRDDGFIELTKTSVIARESRYREKPVIVFITNGLRRSKAVYADESTRKSNR